MPIRLNLLAEAQAEEELRRTDPVKRAIWLAGFLVCGILVYSGVLMLQTMLQRSALNQIESQLDSQRKRDTQITANEKNLAENNRKLHALHKLAANRFLWGNVFNALQQSALEDVQLTHFRSEQIYSVTAEVKPVTENVGHVIIGKPGFVTQKINFYLDAKDVSPNPGDRIAKYKEALTVAQFFGKGVTNALTLTLKNLSAPTFDAESSKTIMLFSLECRFADTIIK